MGVLLRLDWPRLLPFLGSEALFIGEVGNDSGELVSANVTVSPIPEPASFAMWGIGLLSLGVWVRLRRDASKYAAVSALNLFQVV